MPKKSATPIADTLITHNGQTQKLKHWARDLGLNYHLLCMRYKRGDRGEHLLRPKAQYTQNPNNIYFRFNGKYRSMTEWALTFRTSIIGVMRRYESGERDFYKLFNITW